MRVCIELNVPDGDFLLQEVETFLEDGLLLDVDGEPAVEQDSSRGLRELGERPELRALGADAVQEDGAAALRAGGRGGGSGCGGSGSGSGGS